MPRDFPKVNPWASAFGFAFGKSLGFRLSLGQSFSRQPLRLFNSLVHSNKISTVQFGIQLCHTDPRLSCSFSTLNPRADRWDFHSVRLFTVEIWLE